MSAPNKLVTTKATMASKSVPVRKPKWLKAAKPAGTQYRDMHQLVATKSLHTVCQEARCPNMGECWSRGVATVMILGDTCTRACGFCAVKTGRPGKVDSDEPQRVAEAVRAMQLRHVVVTSVDRDDLPDGGAEIWRQTIEAIRAVNPHTKIEVLTPDFKGIETDVATVLRASPDIFSHNVETVPSLHRQVRPQASYKRSLGVLKISKQAGFVTKSGLMVGLGEAFSEVVQVMRDLVAIGVDILTLGQYMQPTPEHLPINRYVHPDEFLELKELGLALGFKYVESGPLVRSSYRADQQAIDNEKRKE
jgi:lipoic acid synthetase